MLDPQESPEEIKSREVELGWMFLLQLFLNSSATDIVLVTLLHTAVEQQLRGTLAATQWRGDMP